MKDINLRFKTFIEKTGFTPSRFAVEIGENHESINRVIRDNNLLPSINILVSSKLRFPLLNVNHIITGEEKMFLSEITIEKSLAEFEQLIATLREQIDEKDSTIGQLVAIIKNMQDSTNVR